MTIVKTDPYDSDGHVYMSRIVDALDIVDPAEPILPPVPDSHPSDPVPALLLPDYDPINEYQDEDNEYEDEEYEYHYPPKTPPITDPDAISTSTAAFTRIYFPESLNPDGDRYLLHKENRRRYFQNSGPDQYLLSQTFVQSYNSSRSTTTLPDHELSLPEPILEPAPQPEVTETNDHNESYVDTTKVLTGRPISTDLCVLDSGANRHVFNDESWLEGTHSLPLTPNINCNPWYLRSNPCNQTMYYW